jgi:hypothetical protein
MAAVNRGRVTVAPHGIVETRTKAASVPDESSTIREPAVVMTSTAATASHAATPGRIDITQ